jgi:hypothetical protein
MRLKAEGDGEESNSPRPHRDIIVSHQSCHDTDAPQVERAAIKPEHLAEHLAVLPAQLEAVAQEGAREDIDNVSAREDINNVSPTDKENATTFTKHPRVSLAA